MDPFSLIPIANNLVPKVYKYKEIIIGRGNPIDRLRIIARGKCGVIKNKFFRKSLTNLVDYSESENVES